MDAVYLGVPLFLNVVSSSAAAVLVIKETC